MVAPPMAATRPEEAVLPQIAAHLEVVHQAVDLPVAVHQTAVHPVVVLHQQEMVQQEREHRTLHRYLPSRQEMAADNRQEQLAVEVVPGLALGQDM